ncbi:MAG: TonB-dependent receptor plug domain-containing protein, partial [Paramuribaculum sp.]|nr:TonB-dependent receptor plug domain-containing protein [Paramuribaculum sp.]
MIHKTGFLGFSLIGAIATAAAEEPADSIVGEQLEEVVILGNSAARRISTPLLGAEHIELSKMTQMPAFGGESDIIKSITLLPGVRSEGEGGGGFEVRGGNACQNLVMLDGITLYNPSHVMGIFSTFNDDALGSATLYKGAIPTSYGGASSSALDTSLAPGDMTEYHGSATVGILAAKIKAEGPIS